MCTVSENSPTDVIRPPTDRPSVLDELSWRGLVALTTDEPALAHGAGRRPDHRLLRLRPDRPSLHFGNLVQLIVLRNLQRAGHRIICLVGGSTGLIGDPRPSAERVLKTKEQTADWVDRIQQQVRPFLDFDGDEPGASGQQPRLDGADERAGLPAGHRQALPGEHDDRARTRSPPG